MLQGTTEMAQVYCALKIYTLFCILFCLRKQTQIVPHITWSIYSNWAQIGALGFWSSSGPKQIKATNSMVVGFKYRENLSLAIIYGPTCCISMPGTPKVHALWAWPMVTGDDLGSHLPRWQLSRHCTSLSFQFWTMNQWLIILIQQYCSWMPTVIGQDNPIYSHTV